MVKYIDPPPPPPQNNEERYFVKGSNNLAESHKTFTYNRQNYPWLTFLFNGWRGVKISWYIIIYCIFDNGIQ